MCIRLGPRSDHTGSWLKYKEHSTFRTLISKVLYLLYYVDFTCGFSESEVPTPSPNDFMYNTNAQITFAWSGRIVEIG